MREKTFDMHVHVYTPEAFAFMREYMDEAGLEGICIQSFGCNGDGCAPEENILPLLFKAMDRRIYAYGSLIYPEVPCRELTGKFDPVGQAERLLEMGFDGIKILESKPDQRKKLQLPLDSELLAPFFAYLEKNGVPILWHVADPSAFWDAARAPAFAVEAGWIYDGSFSTRESIYSEVFHVLDRYPDLKVIFAHFFFMSESVERAREIMERYPRISFDITPGIEMYEDFSKAPAQWGAFFSDYAGRILFGTDADEFGEDIMCEDEKSPVITAEHILRFLSGAGPFGFWGREVTGIGLAERALREICRDNFFRLTGERRRVDFARLREYAEDFGGRIPDEKTRGWIMGQLAGTERSL